MTCFRLLGFSDQDPKHLNLCQYIESKVPSLRLHEQSTHQQNETSILKTLSSVMLLLQGYSFISFEIFRLIYYSMSPCAVCFSIKNLLQNRRELYEQALDDSLKENMV